MILVAGGSGRLGSLLVRRLVAGGATVRVLTRTRARAAHLDAALIAIVEGDVRVASDAQRAAAGARVVVSAVHGFAENPINFISVRDVAALVDRVIGDQEARGHTIEIGGPEKLTLTRLATAIQAAGTPVAPRHVPRAALKALSVLLRPFWPERARQGAAAFALDTMDLRFDPLAIRARYPDISLIAPSELLAHFSREKRAGRIDV